MNPLGIRGSSSSLLGRQPTNLRLHIDTLIYRNRINAALLAASQASILDDRDFNLALLSVDSFVRGVYRSGLRDLYTPSNNKILVANPFFISSTASLATRLITASVRLWSPSAPHTDAFTNFVAADLSKTIGVNPGASNTTKFIDTGLPHSIVSSNDTHLAFYNMSPTIPNTGKDIGVATSDNFQLFIRFNNASQTFYRSFGISTCIENATIPAQVTDFRGFYLGSKIGVNSFVARNGVAYGTRANSLTGAESPLAENLTVFRAAAVRSRIAGSYYSIGRGLTQTEAATYNTLVQSLITGMRS